MTSNPQAGSNGPYSSIPANAANAGGAGIMPSAGHYADMQTLMQNLDALSGWLQQNREDFEGLQDGLRRVEGVNGRRIAAGGVPLENGVAEEDDSQTIANLRTSLAASETRITNLEASLSAFQNLHNLFTTTLTETMRLIRNYTYTQQTHITDLHRHYTRLLQDARYETVEARTTHQKWQESLASLSESTRAALEAREKEVDAPSNEKGERDGLRAENRGLKWENKILRKLAGWREREETEEELEEEERLRLLVEELEQQESQGQGQAQGRVGGRGSIGLGAVERVVT